MSRRLLSLILAIAVTAPAARSATARAQEAPPDPAHAPAAPSVTRFALDNGLRVALRPLSQAKQVAVVLLFDFGEDADPAGMSGFAHFAEHLFCTAAAGETPARTADEFMASGASGANAQTGWDYTVFARVVAPERVEAELDDAAARLGDLRVTQADLDRERPRILAELANMHGAMPRLGAMNLARDLLFRPQPDLAKARRGGVEGSVAKLALEDVASRMAAIHRAGNARLVLAGKFDAAEAEKLVRERFARLPRGTPPDRAALPSVAAPTEGDAPVVVARTGPAGGERWAALAWRGPRPGDPGHAAFTVLAARLAMRTSAGPRSAAPGPVAVVLPVDDPGIAWMLGRLRDGETADEGLARLRSAADGTLATRAADGALVAAQFGSMLDTWNGVTSAYAERFLAMNPYGAAFGIARRDQLGLDGPALGREMAALTADDLQKARARWFADPVRVVVEPAP